jgi:hypothetical protein
VTTPIGPVPATTPIGLLAATDRTGPVPATAKTGSVTATDRTGPDDQPGRPSRLVTRTSGRTGPGWIIRR